MIILIAAIDQNNLIGCDAKIPWTIPEDFKHFKNRTLGHPIIMGRRTWDSLPVRPLPARQNIIITTKQIDGQLCMNYDDLLAYMKENPQTYYVIGGQSVYEKMIGLADRLVISHIRGSYEGNVYFPKIDTTVWKPTTIEPRDNFTIVDYVRI